MAERNKVLDIVIHIVAILVGLFAIGSGAYGVFISVDHSFAAQSFLLGLYLMFVNFLFIFHF